MRVSDMLFHYSCNMNGGLHDHDVSLPTVMRVFIYLQALCKKQEMVAGVPVVLSYLPLQRLIHSAYSTV